VASPSGKFVDIKAIKKAQTESEATEPSSRELEASGQLQGGENCIVVR
jgi:hypothetical protein